VQSGGVAKQAKWRARHHLLCKPVLAFSQGHMCEHSMPACCTHLCTMTGQLKARPAHSSAVVFSGSGRPSTAATQHRWCELVKAVQRSAAGWRGERLTAPLRPLTLTCKDNDVQWSHGAAN